MTQKISTKETSEKEVPEQLAGKVQSTVAEKAQLQKTASKPAEVKAESTAAKKPELEKGTLKPEPVEPKLSDVKLILDALTATILEHTRQIAELQEALARKRKPVASNGKVQIKDKQTGKVYPSKNATYQTLLKAGELKDLVDAGIFGTNPAKNTFGWYALVRALPDRFEEVKPEEKTEESK